MERGLEVWRERNRATELGLPICCVACGGGKYVSGNISSARLSTQLTVPLSVGPHPYLPSFPPLPYIHRYRNHCFWACVACASCHAYTTSPIAQDSEIHVHLPKYLSLLLQYLLYAHIYHNIRHITIGSISQKMVQYGLACFTSYVHRKIL